MKNILFKLSGFLPIVFVCICTLPTAAATYTVTNTGDSGPGSLRAAVAAANATPDNDVIVFEISGCPNGVCMIVLTSGEIVINVAGNLAISNPSGPRSLIVSGNNASRIFRLSTDIQFVRSVKIDGMTLRDGLAPGGLEPRGGAIYNEFGILEITRSEIIYSSAGFGGGISSGPYTYIQDSTIANNVAGQRGGGIEAGGTAVVANSTLSGNSAFWDGGGGVFEQGYIYNVTITQNQAGQWAGLNCFLHKFSGCGVWNSIITGNTPDEVSPFGVDWIDSIIGEPAFLGPLADNGGPTRTHALLNGSPAINAGNNCVLTENGCGHGNPALRADQRGFARVGVVDIGAFEKQSLPATFTVTNTNDSGPGSLREAITAANSTSSQEDVIVFDIPGCPNGVCTITLTSGSVGVNTGGGALLTISNPKGPQSLIIRGNGNDAIFITAGGLTLDGLTLEHAFHAVEMNGALVNISNSIFRNNGTAIYGEAATVVIARSEFLNNVEAVNAGGVSLVLFDSTVADNSAGINLGHPFEGSNVRIVNCTISGNRPGGAVRVFDNAYLDLINTTITNNFAQLGGGIYVNGGAATVRNSIIADNIGSSGYPDIYGPINDLGNNIISQPALLGPLASNGGPTRTHALFPASPAINAGDNCVLTANGCGFTHPALTTDQRGLPRNGAVDIGAFERQPTDPTGRTPFDYDGDGKSDYSVWRPGNSTWYLALSESGSMYVQSWGQAADKIVPADYDGDGVTDLAVWRPSVGKWYVIHSGDGTLNYKQFGVNGDVPLPQDFDGDGRADLGIWRPSVGKWYLAMSRSGSMYVAAFGVSGDKPVPADFDGDGRSEIAVWRPSNGRWYVGNIATGGYSTFGWGVAGDMPAVGDYSGDGKADYAVYRPSNQTWYRVHTDTFNIIKRKWGETGDIPAPGDFDGDGKLDLAVFRPTAGRWYVLTATNTIIRQQFGLNGDIPTESAFVY